MDCHMRRPLRRVPRMARRIHRLEIALESSWPAIGVRRRRQQLDMRVGRPALTLRTSCCFLLLSFSFRRKLAHATFHLGEERVFRKFLFHPVCREKLT